MKDIQGRGSGTVLDDDRVPVPTEEDQDQDQTSEAQFLGLEDGAVGPDEFEFVAVEAQASGQSGGESIEFVLPVQSDDME